MGATGAVPLAAGAVAGAVVGATGAVPLAAGAVAGAVGLLIGFFTLVPICAGGTGVFSIFVLGSISPVLIPWLMALAAFPTKSDTNCC